MTPTILCFKEHSEDGLVWWVRHRGQWKTAASVELLAPVRTVYRGKTGRQPHAYLECLGDVVVTGKTVLVVESKPVAMETMILKNGQCVPCLQQPLRARREAR